jgi:hypothetical protein
MAKQFEFSEVDLLRDGYDFVFCRAVLDPPFLDFLIDFVEHLFVCVAPIDKSGGYSKDLPESFELEGDPFAELGIRCLDGFQSIYKFALDDCLMGLTCPCFGHSG